MALCVVRSRHGLVRPSEKTPTTTLQLSALDKVPVLRCNARSLHVYKEGGEGAAAAIREAISKALVLYYPLAGRLKDSSQLSEGLQLECCGEGVWFVEASASCTLDALNYLYEDAASISYQQDDLLPNQVPTLTQFECGGFVIGLVLSHTICDGLGAAQFLNAVGELARGVHHLSVSPVWCRDLFQSPPTPPQQPPPPPMPNYRLEQANVDISFEQINKLKQDFQASTGQRCSSFEVVAATFWTSRTRAIHSNQDNSDQLLTFIFFANCRQLLEPPLPEGFYGNCFFPVTITASRKWVAEASYVEIIKLIQQGKANLPNEFAKYSKGELNQGEYPFFPPVSYNTLFLSEWGRLGFNDVDFGWGPPANIVAIQGSAILPAGIVGWLPPAAPKKGIRLMTWCVEEAHRHSFLDHVMKFFNSN
ncbi:hypothetical protein UlMin_030844 [Ulmus minor]